MIKINENYDLNKLEEDAKEIVHPSNYTGKYDYYEEPWYIKTIPFLETITKMINDKADVYSTRN